MTSLPPPEKINKALARLMVLVNIIAAVILGLVGYLVFLDDTNPLQITEPLQFTQESFAPGDQALLPFSFCKSTDAPGEMRRSWVSSTGESWLLPSVSLSYASPECRERTLRFEVPPLPAGQWALHLTFVYRVNPLAERVVDVQTEYIEIVNEEDR